MAWRIHIRRARPRPLPFLDRLYLASKGIAGAIVANTIILAVAMKFAGVLPIVVSHLAWVMGALGAG